jgi:hypothetical protein
MGKWFSRNFKTIIYVAFLVPIITVAIVSISHVTQWYGISNPLSWAVYLSIGIEIAALSALAAISAQMGSKVYFPFGIVTLIQFVGNIFFAFEYIKIDSQQFLSWVELTGPILEYTGIEQGDLQSHRRFLAIFAGGMLPLISLSFLHMLVKFNEENKKKSVEEPVQDNVEKEVKEPTGEETKVEASDLIGEISRFRPSEDDLKNLQNILETFKPEEPKKRITKEEQRELLNQMVRESEELGLYDEPFDNPLIKEDETPEPPSWMDEIPEPTEEDYRDWDVTLEDGLEDEVWDEDHAHDMVLNDMVDGLTEEEINEIINEEESLPEPTKRVPNRYEQLEEYLNQTRSWDDSGAQLPDKVETGTLDLSNGSITITNTDTPNGIDVVLDELPTPTDSFDVQVNVEKIEPTPQPTLNFVFKQPLPLEENQDDENNPEKKN